jgi:hypothetical protein
MAATFLVYYFLVPELMCFGINWMETEEKTWSFLRFSLFVARHPGWRPVLGADWESGGVPVGETKPSPELA